MVCLICTDYNIVSVVTAAVVVTAVRAIISCYIIKLITMVTITVTSDYIIIADYGNMIFGACRAEIYIKKSSLCTFLS